MEGNGKRTLRKPKLYTIKKEVQRLKKKKKYIAYV
jgi:hypothetical protein